MLQKNYELAIKNHQEHLNIATELHDKQGQRESCGSRVDLEQVSPISSFITRTFLFPNPLTFAVKAWMNLRNAYHAQGNQEKTVYYHKLVQAAQVCAEHQCCS